VRSVSVKPLLRNVLAVLAAVATTVVLSYATDFALESAGILPKGSLDTSYWIVLLVVAYRTVYNAIGGYVAARVAATHKVGIAVGIGIAGGLLSVATALAPATRDLGPMWYGVLLGVLAVPATWLGARVAVRRAPSPPTDGEP
jgi:hypothetical protein